MLCNATPLSERGIKHLVHVDIDPNLKADVEFILSRLGLTPSDAANLFFRQIVLIGGLPEMKVLHPNAETIEAMEEARRLVYDDSAKTFYDIESLMRDLEE